MAIDLFDTLLFDSVQMQRAAVNTGEVEVPRCQDSALADGADQIYDHDDVLAWCRVVIDIHRPLCRGLTTLPLPLDHRLALFSCRVREPQGGQHEGKYAASSHQSHHGHLPSPARI